LRWLWDVRGSQFLTVEILSQKRMWRSAAEWAKFLLVRNSWSVDRRIKGRNQLYFRFTYIFPGIELYGEDSTWVFDGLHGFADFGDKGKDFRLTQLHEIYYENKVSYKQLLLCLPNSSSRNRLLTWYVCEQRGCMSRVLLRLNGIGLKITEVRI